MRFTRVKKVATTDNSERSLVLRQQYAIKTLDLLDKGCKILCIDQSWLSTTNFIRQKYKDPYTTNSIEERVVNPRIALIAAIDTEGDTYLSLGQVNTDTDIMKLFLSKLVLQLDRDRPSWREDTLMLFDNA